MNKNIENDFNIVNYFDSFDIENAKQIKHPLIKKAQENARNNKTSLFDDDIVSWLSKQPPQTKKHFNNMLREMIAIQKEQVQY